MRKNSDWVNAVLPQYIQDFRRGLYERVADRLYPAYRQTGGASEEKELIKKIMTLIRLYENNGQDALSRPDGKRWHNDDEIWECRVAFAGSESEAKCIGRTMQLIFKPLAADRC